MGLNMSVDGVNRRIRPKITSNGEIKKKGRVTASEKDGKAFGDKTIISGKPCV